MTPEEMESMATAHAEWYTKNMLKIAQVVAFTTYHDAFLHGMKHGGEPVPKGGEE